MSRYLPVLLIALILSACPVYAQVTTATIAGVAQDASGAVIPGVSVTVKNLDTGITRTVTTDEGGRYTVPDLTIGSYEVEAQLPGFDDGGTGQEALDAVLNAQRCLVCDDRRKMVDL